jgi:L-arabinokinase
VSTLGWHSFRRFVAQQKPGLFERRLPVTFARAPGRLDVMGGVADYSGSTVLEYPLAAGTWCALQWQETPTLWMMSPAAAGEGGETLVTVPLSELQPDGIPVLYEEGRRRWAADPRTRWAAYVLGCFLVLAQERRLPPWRRGATVLVASDLPLSSGVASSASLEVAVMTALAAAAGVSLDGIELALLCQKVENQVVGAPCGIMDQVTCALGEKGKLLALRCQPAELLGHQPLPPSAALWGIGSGVKHSVGGRQYGRARCAAFMGLRLIAEALGRSASSEAPYGGYLCNITPAEFISRWRSLLPPRLSGAEFLARFQGTDDAVTTVDPAENYAIRGAVEHAVYENHRVQQFRRHLARATGDPTALVRAGRLMYASHWSYGRRIGLGAMETDLLVRLARERGPDQGIYGAKITGGGCGGTVALLTAPEADAVVAQIAAEYARRTGNPPSILTGDTPMAIPWGTRTLVP